jgi:PAS domain S-box-containing protein
MREAKLDPMLDQQGENKPMELTTSHLHVLVVEDERVVAKDLQRTLIRLGYHVPITVASADDALRAAAERCPDLVLMDIRIQGERDGIETAQLLKHRFDIPIIYLTAYADQATVARAKTTEPHAYLLKPVRLDELRSAVEIAIYKHGMERNQRERERWFATTLRSIGDAVISTDAEGRITLMNPMAETMTGVRTADVAGKRLSEVLQLVDESTQQPIEDPVAQVVREGKILRIDGVLKDRGGGDAERIIADSAAPIVDDQGKLLGVVVVFRDVSETRRMQRRLEFAERLTSLGTLAAGVAHEVNNPLSFVISNLDFALTELQRNRAELRASPWFGEVEQALSEAQIGAERVRQIVADLRAFARPSSPQPDRLDVNRILQSSIDMVAHQIRSRGQLVTEFGSVPAVMGNETRLSQVFVNLLVNAAHAVASPEAVANEVRVRTHVEPDGRVSIEVQDTGCGMSEEVQKRMFDPFFTTKEPGLGTGLGLAVCHGIVTSLQGEIHVRSRAGHGTTFRVTLPAAPLLSIEPPKPTPSAMPPIGPSADVLVIDDEPLLANMIARTIGNEHRLTLVGSAEEALALVDSGKRYDVILSDLMMRGLTGMDLHAALLKHHPEQARRMLFLSGGAFTREGVDFLQLMMRRHLAKPFSPEQLRALLREHIAKWGRLGAAVTH